MRSAESPPNPRSDKSGAGASETHLTQRCKPKPLLLLVSNWSEMSESKNKAPSVIIDPTVLGDRLPRDRDSVAAKKEQTKQFRDKHHKIKDQDLLANQDMAKVNFIDPVEFQRRLRKLNSAFRFAPGGVDGCCAMGAIMLDDDEYSPTKGQIVINPIACGFRVDRPIPEFSWLDTDNWGIAIREGERGWRTVLIRLIQSGFLKYSAVKAEFGEPLGARGKAWHEQLREYKI